MLLTAATESVRAHRRSARRSPRPGPRSPQALLAASTEPTPNPAAPVSSSLRGPVRSPSVPMVIMSPATMTCPPHGPADITLSAKVRSSCHASSLACRPGRTR